MLINILQSKLQEWEGGVAWGGKGWGGGRGFKQEMFFVLFEYAFS